MARTWIFSNNSPGYYEESDWDTSTILGTKHYYFKTSESNRAKVEKGDTVLFRPFHRTRKDGAPVKAALGCASDFALPTK